MSATNQDACWEATVPVSRLKEGDLIEHISASKLILLTWVDGRPWAAIGLCPHQFARLSEGRIEAGRLHCPRHQASFCLATGAPDDRWQISGIGLYKTRVRNEIVEVDISGPS